MPIEVDPYRTPALVLLIALVAVFGTLWLQGPRSQCGHRGDEEAPTVRRRKLLWLTGWAFEVIRLGMAVSGRGQSGVGLAVMRGSVEMAPLMFLASLAPQYLTRKPRILFVVAFGTPLLLYTVLVSLIPASGLVARTLLLIFAGLSLSVAALWSVRRRILPIWLSLAIVGLVGSGCIWLTVQQDYGRALMLAESGVLLMSAFLFALEFRRVTAGVVFTAGGLTLWALPAMVSTAAGPAVVPEILARSISLVKVITAMGMVVLVLEDEIASNLAAQQRDRRARAEIEKYTEIHLAPMPFEENDAEYDRICATIAAVSRFGQAAIFVRNADGAFRMAGRAGMDGALEGALDALARRTTEAKTREVARGSYFVSEIGSLTLMDLSPLMEPGDELKLMNFRKAHVMGIRSRDGRLQGALLLAGLKKPEEPLLTEDVLPLEMLVSRIAAAREHQALVRRLIQSERLGGLGQLAGGVAHELNNPLTVVTGYAQLLAESDSGAEREAAEVILNESRRMKQIIESMLRFRSASPAGRELVSLGLVLEDIEKLVRPELDRTHVELRLNIAGDLPRVRADGDQIRQVFLQVIRNAISSLEETPEDAVRRLTVQVVAVERNLQVMFSDTGPGFADTARAFDPFYTTRHPGEGVGLGLSICYAIIREHRGEISAVNLHPHGAAVVIELPAEEAGAAPQDLLTEAVKESGVLTGDEAAQPNLG